MLTPYVHIFLSIPLCLSHREVFRINITGPFSHSSTVTAHRSPAPALSQQSPLRHRYMPLLIKKKPSFSWASQAASPQALQIGFSKTLLLYHIHSLQYTQGCGLTFSNRPTLVVCSSVAAHAASPLTHILRWWNGAPSSGQIPIITNN